MQIKTTLKYHFTPVRRLSFRYSPANVGEDVEKKEFYSLSSECKYSYYGKSVWRFLKKLKIEVPYDPTISFLDVYSENSIP